MTEDKKIYGLLGRDIGYSLSPVMHNAAFEHFDINAEYKLFDKNEDELEKFFKEYIVGGKLSGLNITIPYKMLFKELLDKQTEFEISYQDDRWPSIAGTINTVKVDGKKLRIANTDAVGFKLSLRQDAGYHRWYKDDIFVFGVGGAGRTICLALAADKKTGKIKFYDSDPAKHDSLKKVHPSFNPEMFVAVKEEDIVEHIKGCSLVVNATPLGTKEGDDLPVNPDLLEDGTVVYDLVYVRETELVKRAKEKKLKAVNGLGMLIWQGAIAFNIWTDKPIEEVGPIMRDAAQKELKKRK